MPPSPRPPDTTHDATRRLAEIVDCLGDAVVTLDLSGTVLSWNRGAEELFGCTGTEAIGSSRSAAFPDDAAEVLDAIGQKVAKGESLRSLETHWRTRTGRGLDLQLTATPLRDSAGAIRGLCLIARDVTALKARERELARVSRYYSTLSQINQAIAHATTREELFQRACTLLVEAGGFHLAWIGWHCETSGLLTPVAACGDADGYLATVKIPIGDHPGEPGPTGAAMHAEEPVVCNDLRHDSLSAPWQAELERRGFRATASLPIRCQGRTCGALSVYAAQPHFFRAKEISLLEEAAKDLS
ncbi:MAG TPA: GAF domain-containing protein, partial [Opitutaceae bacterium]